MFQKNRYKLGNYVVDSRRNYEHKRAVVMVHGIGVSGKYYVPLAKLFAKTFNVHIVDMPGYGRTPKPPYPLTPIEQADTLAEYMKEVGLSKAMIVGQSMGCQTASQFAVRHAHLCEQLILIGPTINKWERRLTIQAFRLLLDTFKEPFKVNVTIFYDYMCMGLRPFFITTRFMIADHIEKTIRQVTSPICIIRGSRDGIAPKIWVEYLAKKAPIGEYHHVKGGPHNVQYSNAKEVFAICAKFLEK